MLKFPNTNIHGYTGTNGLYKGISRRTITNSYVDPPIFVGGIHGGKPPVMAISSPLSKGLVALIGGPTLFPLAGSTRINFNV